MCSHYQSPKDQRRIEGKFQVQVPAHLKLDKNDIWPTYESFMIRRPREASLDTGDEAVPEREIVPSQFGLVPHFADDTNYGKRTFNARTETVAKLASFRDAWKKGNRCIIPVDAFYEPDWRTGKFIPTRISHVDGEPLGIAGLWSWWKPKDGGEEVFSFTMLTINADGHQLMQNFHKPGAEKRMIVILPAGSYQDWLTAPPGTGSEFFQQYPAERLVAEARPAPPRKAKKESPDA